MAWWMYIQCHVVGVVHNVMTPPQTHTAELPFDPLRGGTYAPSLQCHVHVVHVTVHDPGARKSWVLKR